MDQKRNIGLAAKYIREGKLVAFPTETVYGLGANALDPMAVAKIFEVKQRPAFDPLIVHIAEMSDLFRLTHGVSEPVLKITKKFWPGPLTLVLRKSPLVPDIVTSGLSTVGIRMPDNEIALNLIRESGCPIAAPSANKFGRISPTRATHVIKNLPEADYILEGGKTKVGIESTIIAFTENGFRILRNGAITRSEIENIMPYDESLMKENKIVAPGMFSSHYSPKKPMIIDYGTTPVNVDVSRAGYMAYSDRHPGLYKQVLRLTGTGNLKEYAVNLFEAMHTLDESEVEIIVAEAVPEEGIGVAIMDRLRKAAGIS